MADSAKIPLFHSEDIIAKYNIKDAVNGYINTVLDYNKKVNIVSRETSVPDLLKIAADCLVPLEFVMLPQGRFFDIGSGGGFPAIVLLLAVAGLEATLFERTGKKAVFLCDFIKQSHLPAEVVDLDFAEAVRRLESGSFDFGTIKLVRPDRKIFRSAGSLLRPGGRLIYYASADKISSDVPGSFDRVIHNYYLDDIKQLRAITYFSKRD